MSLNSSLYKTDFYTRTQQQAEALKCRDLECLDWQNLVEEFRDLGNRHYDQLSSRLRILIINMSVESSERNIQQLNEFDFASARHFLRKKHEALQVKRLLLWEKASQESQNIVEMILQNYHPQKIIQWGSLLEPKHFSEASDIDLAIVGLDAITFMKLLADAEDLTTFPLDLVRWEAIDPSFQKIILMKGKILYGER